MIQLEEIKNDFLSVYGNTVCAEAVNDVKKADDLTSLVSVLFKHVPSLGETVVPTVDWVRKWFEGRRSLLNKCGVYLDQTGVIVNRDRAILYGDCKMVGTFSDIGMHKLYLMDNSHLDINAMNFTSILVVLKGQSTMEVKVRDPHVLIHKIEKR